MPHTTTLRRELSLPLLTLYGLGTTVGAGIYALTGVVAHEAGMQAPVSFLVAATLVGFTGLSFAELSSRYPRAAGEALFVRKGFGIPALSTGVGLAVVAAGTVSAATVSVGFAGYLRELAAVPATPAILALTLGLGLVAVWGIRESVTMAAVLTLIELGGLILVIWTARHVLADFDHSLLALTPGVDPGLWHGVMAGAVLAFFAFIGFEDMVNVAEEVKDAPRTMPRAIVLTLTVTTVLYVTLGTIAVLAVDPHELGLSEAPLVLVYRRAGGSADELLSTIGALAMINGALIQIIMASRILYGLASRGALPAWLAVVHQRRRTPVAATLLTTAGVAVLAVLFPLARLAETTSVITLSVFATVNAALWRIKGREPAPADATVVPRWIPLAGLVASVGVLLFEAATLVAG